MDRQSDILLESGTNELGVMEFTIGGEIFGINVAKVLEIMMACPVVPMQKAQKDIEGIFKSRDMLLTVIAEDSMLLSKMIVESLRRAGYENLTKVDNGQEAWDFLQEVKNSQDPLENHVCCVVTDIEMPQMDGHHLTKLIKEDPVLKKLPVILFSSLITEEMKIKGRQLGADAQISKPEIASLVSIIDGFVLGQK